MFFLGSAAGVPACTCGGKAPCRAYYDADLVFTGKAVKATPHKVKFKRGDDDEEVETEAGKVDFEVSEVFGNVKKLSEVAVVGDTTTCALEFKIDEKYLVLRL